MSRKGILSLLVAGALAGLTSVSPVMAQDTGGLGGGNTTVGTDTTNDRGTDWGWLGLLGLTGLLGLRRQPTVVHRDATARS